MRKNSNITFVKNKNPEVAKCATRGFNVGIQNYCTPDNEDSIMVAIPPPYSSSAGKILHLSLPEPIGQDFVGRILLFLWY